MLLLLACSGEPTPPAKDDTGDTGAATDDTGGDTDTRTRPPPPRRLNGDLDLGEGVKLSGTVVGDAAGISVSGAGDVTGDGDADVLVGAWHALDEVGEAYVVAGPVTDDFPLSASLVTVAGEAAEDRVGWRVAGPGDLNGDGVGEVLVASPWSDFGTTDAGAAGLFFGPLSAGDRLLSAADVFWTGQVDDDRLGMDAAAAGDVNGDGLADVVVGMPGSAAGKGRTYVYFGHADGVASGRAEFQGEVAGDETGTGVARAGDLDGDGLDDVAIAAPGVSDGAGVVYVVAATNALPSELADAPLRVSGPAGGELGSALLGAGDVDGDGDDDLLVGAPRYSGALSLEGAVFVVGGGTTGAVLADDLPKITGDLALAFAGTSLAAADLDGDGAGDLAVGVPNASESDSYAGLVALLYGPWSSVTGLSGATGRLLGADAQGLAGTAVANAGDSDGDTWDNLVVGVPGAELSTTYASAAYLVPVR
ncbi:MAG: integrin alpha [Myxococcota bacterium]